MNVYGECLGAIECQCDSLSDNFKIINCRNKQLTSVPKFASSSIRYQEISLEGNRIQNLAEASFDGLSVDSINLNNNQLVYISSNAFVGVDASLKTLILGLNVTAAFPSLFGLINLKSLQVFNFGGSNLPADAFNGFHLLEELILAKGQLTDMSTSSLNVLGMLNSLILNSNRFTTIPPPSIFTQIPTLRKLSMTGNLISYLNRNSFSSSSILQDIDLSMNNFGGNIASDSFSGLATTLKYLTFTDCQLTDVSTEAFVYVKSLTSLNLKGNSIVNLPDNFFRNFSSLIQLNVAENKITRLSDNLFKGPAIPLLNFNLESNPLTITPSNVFASLVKLENLKLKNLQSASFGSQSLQPMRNNLKFLDLANTPLDDSIFPALSPLLLLQELNLSSCSIKSIPDLSFKNNPNLRSIDLSRNSLSSLSQRVFEGLEKSLIELNLDSNRLTTLERCAWSNLQYFDPLKLSVQDNPLKCDCNLRWLFNKIKEVNELYLSKLSWKCDDGVLFSLKGNVFVQCPTSEEPCPNFNDNSTARNLIFEVRKITENSAELYWRVFGANIIYGFELNHESLLNPKEGLTTMELPASLQEFVLTGLSPSTRYRFCIKLLTSMEWTQETKYCKDGETLASSYNNLLGPILGGVLGGIAFIVLISILVICLVFRMRKSKTAEKEEYRDKPTCPYIRESYSNRQSTESVSQISFPYSNREIPPSPGPFTSTNLDQNTVLSFMLAATAPRNSSAGQEKLSQKSGSELDITSHVEENQKVKRKKRSKRNHRNVQTDETALEGHHGGLDHAVETTV